MALAVVEHIIGIARNVDLGSDLAGFRVEHNEFGWHAAANK